MVLRVPSSVCRIEEQLGEAGFPRRNRYLAARSGCLTPSSGRSLTVHQSHPLLHYVRSMRAYGPGGVFSRPDALVALLAPPVTGQSLSRRPQVAIFARPAPRTVGQVMYPRTAAGETHAPPFLSTPIGWGVGGKGASADMVLSSLTVLTLRSGAVVRVHQEADARTL